LTEYHVAWWNLENLFDVEDSPHRTEHLKNVVKGELKGWSGEVLSKKITQLSTIISKMNAGSGPDVLGICEVENKPVMDQLVGSLDGLGRNYQVAHHDCSDKRGIDVAFIYDGDAFTQEGEDFHVILKRTATRDLYQVELKSAAGNTLILIGNHWPARTKDGPLKTEPYRIIAAETLGYWNDKLSQERGSDVHLLIMGDFNDEPFSRSVTEYALGTNCEMKVTKAKGAPRLHNLMWPLMGEGIGTFYWNNFPHMFDQFLVSKGFLKEDSPLKILTGSATIERYDELKTPDSDYEVPRPFGRPSKTLDEEGYSDHFPISLKMVEE
jgi:hypothetical protein